MGLTFPHDVGWVAGFLDGEGYFSIYSRGSNGQGKGRSYLPRALIRVNQAGTREPLDRLVELLGGSIHQASRKTATGKDVWGWQLQSAAAFREYLPLIIPYMSVKHREAQVVLDFAKLVRDKGTTNTHLTSEQIEERQKLAQKLLAIRGGQ